MGHTARLGEGEGVAASFHIDSAKRMGVEDPLEALNASWTWTGNKGAVVPSAEVAVASCWPASNVVHLMKPAVHHSGPAKGAALVLSVEVFAITAATERAVFEDRQ